MPSGSLALAAAVVLLTAFVADVTLGAVSQTSMIGDAGEMLVLFAACIAFVVGVLQRERDEALERSRGEAND